MAAFGRYTIIVLLLLSNVGCISVFVATFNYHRTPHYRTGDEVRQKPPLRLMTSTSAW